MVNRIENLTLRTIAALRPEASRFIVWDSELAGFGLRVEPTGRKTYLYRYRAGGGGRNAPARQVKVATQEGEMTPQAARKLAKAIATQVANGKDPAAARSEVRKAQKISELVEAFLSEHVASKRKKSTGIHYRSVLNAYLVPRFGSRRINSLARSDVARLHSELRDKPYQANRLLAVIASLYAFAERRGFVEEGFNPARKIERYREDRRERFLSTAELERFGTMLRLAETEGVQIDGAPREGISPHAAAALRLLLTTGCRVGEVLSLKWEYVDFERGLLLLPDSKTGRKSITLNAPALAVLESVPKVAGNPFVFVGRVPGEPLTEIKRPWRLVRTAAGLADVRLHDLRHTFASYGAGANLGLPIIGKLLGHSQPATTARYAHLDVDPIRKASNIIGGRIAAAFEGKSGEVIKLGKAG